MFTWAEIILAVLKIVQWLIQYGQEQKWIAEGERRAIAAATAEVLRKQEFANATLKDITGLDDDQLDNLLLDLASGK